MASPREASLFPHVGAPRLRDPDREAHPRERQRPRDGQPHGRPDPKRWALASRKTPEPLRIGLHDAHEAEHPASAGEPVTEDLPPVDTPQGGVRPVWALQRPSWI